MSTLQNARNFDVFRWAEKKAAEKLLEDAGGKSPAKCGGLFLDIF